MTLRGVPMGAAIGSRPPARVCFNFLAKCNMVCPYCYCPFDANEAGIDTWKRIIDHIARWGTKSITFGGGDPFLYDDFPELLSYTAQSGRISIIQVDTNGICLAKGDYPLIKATVDLLGIPLDGSNSEIHRSMRLHASHFDIVHRLLGDLTEAGVSIKINTVVSKKNIDDLENLAEVLSLFQIKIWSLYEFWALGPWGLEHAAEHSLSSEYFLEKAEYIRDKCRFARVEIGSVEDRRRAYFFVSHAGRVYTIDRVDPCKYVELGSIFDEGVLEAWAAHTCEDNVASRIRYDH